MKYVFSVFIGILLLQVFATDQCSAIPAFARKYSTSCMTCHQGFPKLNAFGEAFRRNGYQFPAGTDPDFVKEQPVSLGSEGNKKAFPDAVWPGTLPGSSPISIFLNGEIDYNPKVDPRWDFSQLGSSIEAVAAGTLGDNISVWGQLALNSDGTVEINRLNINFMNIFDNSLGFNAKVGVFEPGLFSFSTHRTWTEGYWLTTRNFNNDPDADPANGMGWTLEEIQKGIEFNGILQGRFGYNAGVVEGFGSPHSNKDYYGHITYKFDGLPLDGVVEGGAAPNNARPYVDNSLTVGAFVYSGTSMIGPDNALQENKFTMAGGDANIFYDRFNLFGGVGIRHDDQPFLGTLSQDANSTVWFVQLDVVAFPWLMPTLRYEEWDGHALDGSNALVSYSDKQFVPGVVGLVRPNVKITLRGSFARQESIGDTSFEPGQVQFAMAVGI